MQLSRLGGAQAIPNIQHEVLAKLDTPSAHLLGIALAPPNLQSSWHITTVKLQFIRLYATARPE